MDTGEVLINHAFCEKCDYSMHGTAKRGAIRIVGKGCIESIISFSIGTHLKIPILFQIMVNPARQISPIKHSSSLSYL
jgi:hypothetical protein